MSLLPCALTTERGFCPRCGILVRHDSLMGGIVAFRYSLSPSHVSQSYYVQIHSLTQRHCRSCDAEVKQPQTTAPALMSSQCWQAPLVPVRIYLFVSIDLHAFKLKTRYDYVFQTGLEAQGSSNSSSCLRLTCSLDYTVYVPAHSSVSVLLKPPHRVVK